MWLVRHLMSLGEAGRKEAASLLLDAEWLEKKVAAGLAYEMLRDISAVLAVSPADETRTIVELVADVVQRDLRFIIDCSDRYPQGLSQTVLNRIEPLAMSTELAISSPAVRNGLVHLISAWNEHIRGGNRQWIRLEWLDREYTYLGPERWQAKLGERSADCVAFSPSGDAVAAASRWEYANRHSPPSEWPLAYEAGIWSAADGRLISRPVPASDSVPLENPFKSNDDDPWIHKEWREALWLGDFRSICWIDDDGLLASGRGGRVFLFDRSSGKQRRVIQHVDAELITREWTAIHFPSLAVLDSGTFVAGTSFGSVLRVSLDSLSIERHRILPFGGFYETANWVQALAVHAGSSKLAVGLVDHTIRIFDLPAFTERIQLRSHTAPIVGLAWSPCGRRLASVSDDRTLRLWNVDDGQELIQPISHPTAALSLCWGITDREFMTTWNENGIGGSIRTWDAATGVFIGEFGKVPAIVSTLAVSRQTGLVATGSRDGYIRVFDPKRVGITVKPEEAHSAPIRDSAFCHLTGQLATIALDGVLLWSSSTGKVTHRFRKDWSDYANWDQRLVYSRDGEMLAASVGNLVYMFRATDLELLWSNSSGTGNIDRCFFSTDGKRFLTDDGKAPNSEWIDQGAGTVVWDVGSGTVVDRSSSHGLEAEDRLREYNLSVAEKRSHAEAETNIWVSWMGTNDRSGATTVNVGDEAEHTRELRLAGEVKRRFQLSGWGQWVLITRGAAAPLKATVVQP